MSTVEQVMHLLIEHPSIPVVPVTNPGNRYRCPACPDAEIAGPNSPSHAQHQAHALKAAGLLRPDLERDFGLSKVQIDQRLGAPTHVRIERGGVPIVDGYIAQPQAALRRAHVPTAAELIRPVGYPGQTLQERLMALADDMGDTPFTAAIVRQFAAEAALMVPIQRPERHGTDTACVSDPYRLDDAGPGWAEVVQQYAERERRVRAFTAELANEWSGEYDVQDILTPLLEALDPTTTTDEDPST